MNNKYFLPLAVSCCIAASTQAQDLAPRLYINLPIDQNFIAASYFYSSGDVDISSSTIEDASVQIEGSVSGIQEPLRSPTNWQNLTLNRLMPASLTMLYLVVLGATKRLQVKPTYPKPQS